jgi:hypothetical protein
LIDADQVFEGRNSFAKFFDLLTEAAVIEEPRGLRVVQEFHVRVGGGAEVDGNPSGSGAQQPQHAEENCGVVVRKDCGAVFAFHATSEHGAGDALAEGASFRVGTTYVAFLNRNSAGIKFGAFVEVVDGSHGFRETTRRMFQTN